MHKKRIFLAPLLVLASISPIMPSAHAGQLSAPNVNVTWDDSRLYLPKGSNCVSHIFTLEMTKQVTQVWLFIINKYGVIVGDGLSSAPSSSVRVQLCGGKDFSGTVLQAKITTLLDVSYVSSTYETPITFLDQSVSKPLPSQTTISESSSDLSTLQAQIKALNKTIVELNKKVKKICSNKPKPKGC